MRQHLLRVPHETSADIASRLGVSRQVVHKRFGGASGQRGPRAVIELRFGRDEAQA